MLLEAISNNAEWCAAVAESHNIVSSKNDQIWFSEQPMPPLYPNIITLSPEANIDSHIHHIDQQLRVSWGVKDSFKQLHLAHLGVAVAIEAQWYGRTPADRQPKAIKSGVKVEYVKTQLELSRWTNAWGDETQNWKLSLLADEAIELLYCQHNNQIVSGLATNLSGTSLGISNAFGSPDGILNCIEVISDKHPSKPIVGYGDKSELGALKNIGFRELGDLQIWLKR